MHGSARCTGSGIKWLWSRETTLPALPARLRATQRCWWPMSISSLPVWAIHALFVVSEPCLSVAPPPGDRRV